MLRKLREQSKGEEKKNKENWRIILQPFKNYPMLYVALILSAFLSMVSGVFIGLGFHVTDGELYYSDDVGHVIAAIMYAVSFPVFLEGGLAYWTNMLMMREKDNDIQLWASAIMVSITGIGTAVTAFSTADIIATGLGFFTSFTEIPPAVQRWMVFSLPAMMIVNILFSEIYRQFSESAKLVRIAETEINERQIEADTEVRIAKMKVRSDIEIAAAKAYAEKAKSEVDSIGKTKGENLWKDDSASMRPAYAQKVELPENFTEGQS